MYPGKTGSSSVAMNSAIRLWSGKQRREPGVCRDRIWWSVLSAVRALLVRGGVGAVSPRPPDLTCINPGPNRAPIPSFRFWSPPKTPVNRSVSVRGENTPQNSPDCQNSPDFNVKEPPLMALQSMKSSWTGKYPIPASFRHYNAAICYLPVSDGKTPQIT